MKGSGKEQIVRERFICFLRCVYNVYPIVHTVVDKNNCMVKNNSRWCSSVKLKIPGGNYVYTYVHNRFDR